MVDIHVIRTTRTASSWRGVQPSYHIPIDARVIGIGPTSENAIGTQFRQAVVDSLAVSSVLGVWSNMVIFSGWTRSGIADVAEVDCSDMYNLTYEFYGGILDAAA